MREEKQRGGKIGKRCRKDEEKGNRKKGRKERKKGGREKETERREEGYDYTLKIYQEIIIVSFKFHGL